MAKCPRAIKLKSRIPVWRHARASNGLIYLLVVLSCRRYNEYTSPSLLTTDFESFTFPIVRSPHYRIHVDRQRFHSFIKVAPDF